MTLDLRLGDWRTALADVECDSVCTDPPYSERTAKGQRGNRTTSWLGSSECSGITYGWLTQDDVVELVNSWLPRTRRWFVMFGDHITVRWALDAMDAFGWYTFPPVIWVKEDAAPRIMGDGPSPQAEQIAIGRSRHALSRAEKRYRPGWYKTTSRFQDKIVMGSKPIWLMRSVIADYSQPGDLIADPFVGGGSTLLAAQMEGRRAVGSERDPETFRKAAARCSVMPVVVGRQEVLFGK